MWCISCLCVTLIAAPPPVPAILLLLLVLICTLWLCCCHRSPCCHTSYICRSGLTNTRAFPYCSLPPCFPIFVAVLRAPFLRRTCVLLFLLFWRMIGIARPVPCCIASTLGRVTLSVRLPPYTSQYYHNKCFLRQCWYSGSRSSAGRLGYLINSRAWVLLLYSGDTGPSTTIRARAAGRKHASISTASAC